ncbi:hypothetical protein [Streptomyces aureoversilis]|uniref:Uncharacterized protein n=1 Tax=Streptomyces aureoversilis TaxID=67277 RepID=A0ABW0ADD0_9ACTN
MVFLASRLRQRAVEQGGRPVTDPVGWLIGWAIPRRAVCPDVRCDDGRRMDLNAACERCAEYRSDLVARRRAVSLELARLPGTRLPAGEYRQLYEARLQAVTRQVEQERATRREKAALERAQRQEDLVARRAEQKVLEDKERAQPCVECGRARARGLCELCGNARASEAAIAEAVEIGLTAREYLGSVAEGEFASRLEAEIRSRVGHSVDQVLDQGATELTASLLRRLASEEQRSQIRRETVELFARGREADAEAEAAFAAQMRQHHLHQCDGQHDCQAFIREKAEQVAWTTRCRVAEHLLEQGLVAVRTQRAALPVPVKLDAYALGAARVRAALRRPRAGVPT